MGRTRDTLHISKLDEFAEWLRSRGWVKEKTKGAFEVLRMRFDKSNILIIHKKMEAKEHCTTFGIGTQLVHKWLRDE